MFWQSEDIVDPDWKCVRADGKQSVNKNCCNKNSTVWAHTSCSKTSECLLSFDRARVLCTAPLYRSSSREAQQGRGFTQSQFFGFAPTWGRTIYSWHPAPGCTGSRHDTQPMNSSANMDKLSTVKIGLFCLLFGGEIWTFFYSLQQESLLCFCGPGGRCGRFAFTCIYVRAASQWETFATSQQHSL